MKNKKEERIKDLQILVIDDCVSMRKQYDEFLKELNVDKRYYAENGEVALNIVKDNLESYKKNGFIICDVNMPEVNGLQFLKEFKKIKEMRDVPFLMVSAENEKTTIIKSIEDGANLYLMKPFSLNTLKKKIMAIMY